MKQYVLIRQPNLDTWTGLTPMVFSTLKKARDWAKGRFPFCTSWAAGPKVHMGLTTGQKNSWIGFDDKEHQIVAVIYSVEVDG